MLKFLFRVVLVMLGLIFAASLAFAALLLAAAWALRSLWARVTGRPVTPWVMRFDPRGGFNRFTAAAHPASPTAADVASARARGEPARSPVAPAALDDVTDVRARPVSRGD